MRLRFLLLVGAGGCNWAFGIDNTALQPYFDAAPPPDGDPRIDLDRDGIKDVEDTCIAPFADAIHRQRQTGSVAADWPFDEPPL